MTRYKNVVHLTSKGRRIIATGKNGKTVHVFVRRQRTSKNYDIDGTYVDMSYMQAHTRKELREFIDFRWREIVQTGIKTGCVTIVNSRFGL